MLMEVAAHLFEERPELLFHFDGEGGMRNSEDKEQHVFLENFPLFYPLDLARVEKLRHEL